MLNIFLFLLPLTAGPRVCTTKAIGFERDGPSISTMSSGQRSCLGLLGGLDISATLGQFGLGFSTLGGQRGGLAVFASLNIPRSGHLTTLSNLFATLGSLRDLLFATLGLLRG